MASSVLQLGRQKCIKSVPRSIATIAQNKFLNQPASVFGLATNKSTSWIHTQHWPGLTANNAISQTNRHHGLISIAQRRYSTDDNRQSSGKLPPLMEFPQIIWPSLLKTMKNWILVNFIIRPYFDREFNMPDFVNGTKHALQVGLFNSFAQCVWLRWKELTTFRGIRLMTSNWRLT